MSRPQTSPEPLRVGFVSPGWPADGMPNGIVSYTQTIVHALQSLGVNCQVLAALVSGDAPDPFVHRFEAEDRSLLSKIMWRVDPTGWQRRLTCAGLLDAVRQIGTTSRLDILELEESFGWPVLLARKLRFPLVVRLHGPWFLNGVANGVPQDKAFHRRDRWEREGLAAADAVTSPSKHVLEKTRQHFALSLPEAQVIPNPVEPAAAQNRWKLHDAEANRIAFIGRFDRHKGGDVVLDALRLVLKQVPDARLDFVGPDRGYIDDGGRTWKIEQYLQQKLEPREREKVAFHGFQPGPRAAEFRKRALVTVAPSRYETFGIAAAEAMMAGCPLVVGGAGALTELVQDQQNGLVARPGDAADLADKVMSLLRNPPFAARLGEQAARDAMQRYAPAIVAQQTLDFYRKVLGRRAADKQVI
ncbi:MAG TPA: glycosyltransferase family 4 protein [Tepidisphaeraceae bacterium]|nr:glycosyltransferase family 4 protein [Tepidisphaeraceae bacterium]